MGQQHRTAEAPYSRTAYAVLLVQTTHLLGHAAQQSVIKLLFILFSSKYYLHALTSLSMRRSSGRKMSSRKHPNTHMSSRNRMTWSTTATVRGGASGWKGKEGRDGQSENTRQWVDSTSIVGKQGNAAYTCPGLPFQALMAPTFVHAGCPLEVLLQDAQIAVIEVLQGERPVGQGVSVRAGANVASGQGSTPLVLAAAGRAVMHVHVVEVLHGESLWGKPVRCNSCPPSLTKKDIKMNAAMHVYDSNRHRGAVCAHLCAHVVDVVPVRVVEARPRHDARAARRRGHQRTQLRQELSHHSVHAHQGDLGGGAPGMGHRARSNQWL